MTTWLIEPRDPLIARDGRPASAAQLTTVEFPFPSTTAGAVRTRLGAGGGAFTLQGEALEELKQIEVHGPLLAELSGDGAGGGGGGAGDETGTGTVAQWLAPAPRDALLAGDGAGGVVVQRLAPRPPGPGQEMDSLLPAGLLPVSPAGRPSPVKPPRHLPAFWRWSELEAWLLAPGDRGPLTVADLGIGKLPVEERVHLALRPGERVGIDGMLFKTAGLRFLQPGAARLAPRRFALSVRCAGGTVAGRPLQLVPQTAPLGGERRLARWAPAPPWPALPAAVREAVARERRARLILATPACFLDGALPAWSGGPWPHGGPVTARVRAAVTPRPAVVSGWDLAYSNGPGKPRGAPKPTRRLVPAGSVFFVDLEGGTADDVRRWCDSAWLAPVSDGEQERRDGFGLAVVGTWSEDR